jgi:two-component system, NarL family, response regulator LiaR
MNQNPANLARANAPAIRVMIVDDHSIVRKGIKALLLETGDIQLIGEARNGLEAIELAGQLWPDVILMDLLMPELDGVEATRRIMAQNPATRVLVLTSFIGDEQVFPAIKAGAMGYLLKDSEPELLLQAIRQVSRGELILPPAVAGKVLQELRSRVTPNLEPKTASAVERLTDREMEVLLLLAKGSSNEEIAAKLQIAEVTVRTHVSHIIAKLHLANRIQVTLYALKEGLVSIDEAIDRS